jgi:hypothetical protein
MIAGSLDEGMVPVSGFSRAHGMPTRLRGETLTRTYVFTNPLHLSWDKPERRSHHHMCGAPALIPLERVILLPTPWLGPRQLSFVNSTGRPRRAAGPDKGWTNVEANDRPFSRR